MNDYTGTFNGLTFGAGTDIGIREWVGLEGFAVRSSDEFTASRWGTIVGAEFVQARPIVLTLLCLTEIAAQQVQTAFVPPAQTNPDALLPLVWKMPNVVEQYVSARVRRRQRPRDTTSEPASLWPVSIELQTPDPRAYSSATHQAALSPFGESSYSLDFSQSSGTNLALDFDVSTLGGLAVDFAGATASGTQFLLNAGNSETWPVVTFAAPAALTSWRLQNLSTGGVASFYHPLTAGQQMVVDFRVVATPRPGDAVLVDGSARYAAWTHPRTPLALAPGLNELRFDVIDGDDSSLAVVDWEDAWI